MQSLLLLTFKAEAFNFSKNQCSTFSIVPIQLTSFWQYILHISLCVLGRKKNAKEKIIILRVESTTSSASVDWFNASAISIDNNNQHFTPTFQDSLF